MATLILLFTNTSYACAKDLCALSPEATRNWQNFTTSFIEQSKNFFLIKTEAHEMSLIERVEAGDRSTSTVRDYVRYRAEQEAISADLVEAIVRAESGFVEKAKNPHSSASGLFQFINGTWLYFCSDTLEGKDDVIKQTDCALRILKEKGGWKHWEASRHVWGKQIDPSVLK